MLVIASRGATYNGERLKGREICEAFAANEFTLVGFQMVGAAAKDAGVLMLLDNDALPFQRDFEGVPCGDLQGATHFFGYDDAAELVDVTDDACGFHGVYLLSLE